MHVMILEAIKGVLLSIVIVCVMSTQDICATYIKRKKKSKNDTTDIFVRAEILCKKIFHPYFPFKLDKAPLSWIKCFQLIGYSIYGI